MVHHAQAADRRLGPPRGRDHRGGDVHGGRDAQLRLRTRPWHAVVATASGFMLLVWVVFGQKILPLPWPLHVNLSIVFATLAIVTVGFALGVFCQASRREENT